MCYWVFVQFRNGAEYIYSHCAETMRLSVQSLRNKVTCIQIYIYVFPILFNRE